MDSVNYKTHEAQNLAAGGEQLRKVRHDDGTVATASVSIQLFPKGYQRWGYLRFKTGGKTKRCYIGKVSAETHDESLAIGWRLAREKGVIERAGWSWLVPNKIDTKTKEQPAILKIHGA